MKVPKKIKDELRQEHLKLCRENLPKLKKDLNHNDRLIVRTRNILDDLLKDKKNISFKEFHGYYFDGEKLLLMYMDKNGNIVTKEDKDE